MKLADYLIQARVNQKETPFYIDIFQFSIVSHKCISSLNNMWQTSFLILEHSNLPILHTNLA